MNALFLTIRQTIDEWLRLRWDALQFGEAPDALLLFVGFIGVAVAGLLSRHARTRRKPGDTVAGAAAAQARGALVVPAIIPSMRRSSLAPLRYLPLLVFLVGIPFFAVALADPHTGFAQEDVSY